jgi:hypothetical protein
MAARDRPDSASRNDVDRNMLIREHRNTLWTHYANLALGLWLVCAPFAAGYLSHHGIDSNMQRAMTERALPPPAWRDLWMTRSDVLSGALIVIFSALSATPARRFPWAQWANAAVGFWLLLAPLVCWTPSPAAYAGDTLLGALVIALSVLIPMMPGMSMAGMMGGPDIPPGWNYCPSTWLQRLPIAALGLLGLLISRYLAAYQLGHTDAAWDPFFGPGTMKIITSDVSRAWPIPDAGLGGVAYMMEVLMAVMGGKQRWRTMPWMVLMFAILIVPLGGVSIFFIIIQPLVIGTWCSLCLVAALAMALMIPYSLDEFVAMGQFLLDAKRRGKSLWRVLWLGDAMAGGSEDGARGFAGSMQEMLKEGARGVCVPLHLALSLTIGVWLMLTRLVFGNTGALANSEHVVGALAVTVSIIAWAEVARAVRWVNLAFGAWLLAAPWLLEGAGSLFAVANSLLCGVALGLLSWPKGQINNTYGGWDRYIA